MRLNFCNYLAIAISCYGFFFFLYLLVTTLYFAAFCYALGCTITMLVYWFYMFDTEDFPFKSSKKKFFPSHRGGRLIRNNGRDEKLRDKFKKHEDVESYRCLKNEQSGKPKNECTKYYTVKEKDSKECNQLLNPKRSVQMDSSSYYDDKNTNKLYNTSETTSNESKNYPKKTGSKSRKIAKKGKLRKLNKKTEANIKKEEDYPMTSIKNSVK